MEHAVEAFWEKARAAGRFVGGIVAIVAVLYGLSWAADEIFAHVLIRADHQWWAYRIWHAWWPVIVPLVMVGIAWPFRRRVLGGGLWASGAVWIAFIGWAVGMMLFLGVFSRVSDRVGFFWGTVLSCAGVFCAWPRLCCSRTFGQSGTQSPEQMMDEATVATMDSLRCLGFQPDPTVVSDECPGLSFDFGNLRLQASSCLNLRCVEIVLFSGVLSTPRTLTEVHFEMPRQIKSLKQCAAWIVWNLDKDADHGVFKSARHVGWLEEGRKNQRLLPWVMSMAEFNARPQCIVQRDWLRLALRTLGEYLTALPDNAGIVFSFDGSVLSIRFDKKVIALPGEGSPWAVRFRVEARTLRRLPKRLMHEDIGVSIWESRITLGNSTYAATLEEFGTTDPSRVQ